MGIALQFRRLCCVHSIKNLLAIFGIVVAVVALVSQLLQLPYENYILNSGGSATDEKKLNANSTVGFHLNISMEMRRNQWDELFELKSPALLIEGTGNKTLDLSLPFNDKGLMENQAAVSDSNMSQAGFKIDGGAKSKTRTPASISVMNSLFLQNSSISLVRWQWHSARERELLNAKLRIEGCPIIRNVPEIHASIFRNYSRFRRSYELMERVLKVYVYKEGEKPIFHQPYLRGIYASEGWFMKLMEKNKQFLVKDPKRAHLFYLPFSSLKLREALSKHNFTHQKDLENHLSNYIGRISRKYHFWNRSRGADHFFVACHDWYFEELSDVF